MLVRCHFLVLSRAAGLHLSAELQCLCEISVACLGGCASMVGQPMCGEVNHDVLRQAVVQGSAIDAATALAAMLLNLQRPCLCELILVPLQSLALVGS